MTACYFGTVMMVVSLAHISGGINLMQSRNHIESNYAMINSLLAACGGALGTICFRALLMHFINKEDQELE